MKTGDKTAIALEQISNIEDEGLSPETTRALVDLLGHSSNHVVGKAARLAGEWGLEEALPHLETAFERFMKRPADSDPNCAAKGPIVEALTKLGCANTDLFLSASRHVQMEPVWGKSVDTAQSVRGLGGRGLASMHYPDATLVLSELLLDPEIETRRITVDTLIELGTNESELLLRIGALLDPVPGNEDNAPPESIVTECLSGLMRLTPDRSLKFVTQFLHRSTQEASGAALALGESRHPEAFSLLKAFREDTHDPELRDSLLLPIALTRDNRAVDLLLNTLRDESERSALAALQALTLFASDPATLKRIQECASEREESGIQHELRTLTESA